VASTTEKEALITATLSESQKPSSNRESRANASYQRQEKPVKWLSCRVLLKENTTKNAKGAYKKA
jgi:hypothetical protein